MFCLLFGRLPGVLPTVYWQVRQYRSGQLQTDPSSAETSLMHVNAGVHLRLNAWRVLACDSVLGHASTQLPIFEANNATIIIKAFRKCRNTSDFLFLFFVSHSLFKNSIK